MQAQRWGWKIHKRNKGGITM